jgi:hypothetical protein
VHDAKYTVGSFAKLLRDLERPPKSSSRRLFDGSRSSPLFKVVLNGAEMENLLLMKSFMEVKSIPTIPHLFEDVPNFKGLLLDILLKGMRH